jgi:hypothetical protein
MSYRRPQVTVSIPLMVLILFVPFVIHTLVSSCSASSFQSPSEIVVLAKREDPYYPLAEEIAGVEGAPLAANLTEALAYRPIFLLWVASPNYLSDEVMIEFGRAMLDYPGAISTGIITGSTYEKARGLWERRSQIQADHFMAANAPNPSAHIEEGQIITFDQEQAKLEPLTKDRFENALQTADYLTFTGHGGNGYLRLDEDTVITPEDVPSLDSLVIGTGSCQTLRPWNENSIARRFIDQGAAAYSGFLFSPNEGYLIGEFGGLPFRYTWPEFPIGHVLQAQNRGTLQGFARFPYQFVLGDPRIALQSEPPYHLVEDRQVGEDRTLTFRDVPAGAIPFRIPGGAVDRFVIVPGLTAAAEGDPFYNSRLQMVDIREDKFILLVHQGGDLTLQFRRQAPWYWFPMDILTDSLDHTFVFSQQASGDLLGLGFAALPLAWVALQSFRKRIRWRRIRLGIVVGSVTAVLQGLYVLARLDQVTITSKEVIFSPLSIVAAFILATCGTLMFFQARSWFGKAIGLSILTFNSWAPMFFGFLLIGAFNLLIFIPKTGAALYNYSLGILPASSFLFTLTLSWLVLWFVNRMKN